MKSTNSARLNFDKRHIYAVVLMVGLAAAGVYQWPAAIYAAEQSLLGGRVTTATGETLAGIPVRVHRDGGNMTVTVYTNSRGEYSFPEWSDVSAGSYSVAIELAEFTPARREAVALSAGNTARVDLTLQPRQPSVRDATASDIIAALPGTDDQKHLLIQCDNCHSLQFALRAPRSKEEWVQIIRRMAGERAVSRETPGTRAFGQKKYVEPLAEYLALVRGPGSSDDIPFKLRPRPTGEASTRVVVTEYDLPRAGTREVNIIRGDRRAAWPHDVLVDPKGPYVWYTDHFAFFLGRLDRRTGEIKEFPYDLQPGMGRAEMGIVAQGQERAGNPGGGAHDMAYDPEGNVIFGMGGGTLRFNPKTEEFTRWAFGSNMFGLDPAGNVWYLDDGLHKLDPKTGETKSFTVPPETDDATYDMEVDPQGRSIMNHFRLGKIGVFDPQTEKYAAYPTPTPGSGPRRGEIDAQGRAWMGLYWAGRVGMFDPSQREIREYPLIPGSKPFTPPFVSPYSVAVDNKNQLVWTNDFNSSRIYRLEMKTGKSTEYFMPLPYEVRDLTVDESAERPTVWIPAYRPPSKVVKVQVW
jgi:virginiamycin B lyase